MKQQSCPNSNSDDVKFYCTLLCTCLLPFLKSVLVNFFGTNSLNEMNGHLPNTLTSTQVKAIYILETEQYVNLQQTTRIPKNSIGLKRQEMSLHINDLPQSDFPTI